MELMQTLDDAWNSQDLGTFNQRHKPEVVVRWPGRAPTHGRHDHKAKAAPSRPFPTSTSTTGPTECSSPLATGPAQSPTSRAP
jgi:hypothetical protein